MELDKKTPLEYRVTNEVNEDENFLVKENKLFDMFPPGDPQMERFHNYISKGIRNELYKDGTSNRGFDRPRSRNPTYDKLEKTLDDPTPPEEGFYNLKDYGMVNAGIVPWNKYYKDNGLTKKENE